ncbi:MAG TPA: hypothetical protein DIT13_01625 [Verrucomicrobiales bacterium]|nr:hypothetical protein [Verrucomicrobiales bacterium]HRK12740.1 MBL fold metallo-hydrolase [Prosthecobacter sp.]
MSSRKPKPCLFVLDVGHGNAAVLHDDGGTVIFDTGRKGTQISRHLASAGENRIEAMMLSHSDADHIGGAVTLLMDSKLTIGEVLLNPDPTKNSAVFEQLCYALAEAIERSGTRVERRLATSTSLVRKGCRIDILHPPLVAALRGVGGDSKAGHGHTSNSLSAAIRVSHGSNSSVLLAGDIEFDCVDGWKSLSVSPSATVLVFPHHGGLPGTASESDAGLFAYELVSLVRPTTVIFSNHRTKHNNPRDKVVSAITKAGPGIRCACTQLPERYKSVVQSEKCWELHRSSSGVVEGTIKIELGVKDVFVGFEAS